MMRGEEGGERGVKRKEGGEERREGEKGER